MRSERDYVAGYESSKVPGATEIGLDSNGKAKSTGHHASHFPIEDIPTSANNGSGSSTTEENPDNK